MAVDDRMLQDELNHEWDALVLGSSGAGRRIGLAALVVELKRRDDSAAPDPVFAGRLRRELQSSQQVLPIAPAVRRRSLGWQVYGFGMVAAVLVLAMGLTIFVEVTRTAEDDAPGVQIGAVDDGATPTVARDSSAVAPGTSTTQAAAPSPSVQLGGDIPIYDELSEVVNAAELIVVARVGEDLPPLESGVQMRVLEIEQVVRGIAPDKTYIAQGGDLIAGVSYVLALNRFADGPATTYTPHISVSPLEIKDGLIVGTEYAAFRPLENRYAGQPLEGLIADTKAIPAIEPTVEALLAEWGWISLGKQALWPLTLPPVEEQAMTQPLRYMPYSWEQLLAASRRVNLDFADLAGADVQLLVYLLERVPEEGTRPIWAGLLIAEQRIVGAWVVPAGAARPFGLDERDAALELPALLPTPEPTPTMPVPGGESVNPVRLYGLEGFANFHICWPYCDAAPRPAELRDAVLAALDRELELLEISVQPTPTQDYSLTPSNGAYIQLLFGAFEPGVQRHIAFGYDRETGMLLLPDAAGWAVAPPELVAALEGIEPPPLPTKPLP